MTSQAAAPNPFQLALRARLDRRSVEALALELRRRVKQLGFDGAMITVAPAREDLSSLPNRKPSEASA